MTELERKMMLGMIDILNEASKAYYSGNPLISDENFDARLQDLREFEKETGIIFSNSPSVNVGTKVLSNLPDVEHNHLMLSLEKCHSPKEVSDFSNEKELVASIKLDGMTVSLLYENGTLVRGESRGNGFVGNDITEHIKRFLNVPLRIDKKSTYIVDGEAIIMDDDFTIINKDNEYKNSRNLIAGTLSSLDTSVVSQRKAKFIVWDVIEGGSTNNLKDNLKEAVSLGFDIVPFWVVVFPKQNIIQDCIDHIFDYASENGYPNDGIVFKFNDIEYGKSLGKTNHHFKNGIAYKAKDDVYETKLIDIDWTIGKSGQITPTAIFETVDIDGSSVSRASLHNISILRELNLCIGDTIEVYKANSIIPQVKRNISAEQRQYIEAIEAPTIDGMDYCPICGGKTEIKQDNDSKVLICTNDNCKGKLLGKLTHFASKNAINVEGLSEQTIEKFIELGWLTCFKDIFTLKDHFTEMVKLDGFGEKSVKKLLDSIEKSKNTTLDRFIYSLSIPLIGRTASKTITKFFEGDFERFYKECSEGEFDFTVLDDFGESMNESINEYLDKNAMMIYELSKWFSFEEANTTLNSNNLSGKVFCITGGLNRFANRDEAKEKIERLGGKVSGSVSAKTSYLVNNDIASTSGKNKKAKELNIPIINEEELIKMLNS